MSDEKENDTDSLMDTISSAVETQKGNAPEGKEEAPKEASEEPVEAAEPESKERDASGRFLPKGTPAKVAKEAETKPEHEPVDKSEPVDKLDERTEPTKPDVSKPPRRLPIRTKAAWMAIPETAREDIWAHEMAIRQESARYEGLGSYVQQAEKNGTSLPAALADYSAMETALRRDPIDGALSVWQKMGYNPQAVVQEIIRRAGGQIGQEGQSQAPMQAPMPPGLTRAEMEMEFARRDNMAKIEAFENDPKHIYLEPLNPMGEQGPIRSAMIHFLTPVGPDNKPLAKTLEDAYDMALRVHPEIARTNAQGGNSEAQKTAAVVKSRAAAKAIGGAPSHGNASVKPQDDGNQTVFDTVRAAVARQRS
jgi:hypothetical protein